MWVLWGVIGKCPPLITELKIKYPRTARWCDDTRCCCLLFGRRESASQQRRQTANTRRPLDCVRVLSVVECVASSHMIAKITRLAASRILLRHTNTHTCVCLPYYLASVRCHQTCFSPTPRFFHLPKIAETPWHNAETHKQTNSNQRRVRSMLRMTLAICDININ